MAANDNEPLTPADMLYFAARRHVLSEERCSISDLQRRFQIGFNRASGIVERLKAEGVVSSPPDYLA